MAASLKLAILVSCASLLAAGCHGSGLVVGYYEETCPKAEAIVRAAVREAVRADAGAGAGLIHILFHDCFVEGCDASVLLDATAANPQPEKLGAPNNPSLRGFEVIDAAKDAIEEVCPGTVSCADIVAFAGRDASYLLSGHKVDFEMPAGRLDGRRSNASETLKFLPAPFLNLTELVHNFAVKGLGVEDMVVLSGAHSVGRAHCSSFAPDRLADAPSTDIDPSFARSLRRRCPAPAAGTNGTDDVVDVKDPTVSQDAVTAAALDSQYYRNVLRRRVLLASDAALLASPETARMVRDAARNLDGRWEKMFGEAMVRMAAIGVKSGRHGEVRTNCRAVN